MNFSQAQKLLEEGKAVSRQAWTGGMYLKTVQASRLLTPSHVAGTVPVPAALRTRIYVPGTSAVSATPNFSWFSNLEDVLAEDWIEHNPTTAPDPDCPMDFSSALRLLKEGKSVTRKGWNGKGMWLRLQVPDDNSKMTLPYIYMRTVEADLVPWLASQTDLLANDWLQYGD